MNLFNLDRFRFEKKTKTEGENSPSSGIPADQEAPFAIDTVDKNIILPSASEDCAATVSREDENVTDHMSEPGTPASDVSEKTDDSSIPETPESKRTAQIFLKYRRDVIELSSESEGEGTATKSNSTKQLKAPRKDVIVISEHSDEDGEEESLQSFPKNCPAQTSDATEEDEEEEDLKYCKLQTLKELFPQKSDQELLQVQCYNLTTGEY